MRSVPLRAVFTAVGFAALAVGAGCGQPGSEDLPGGSEMAEAAGEASQGRHRLVSLWSDGTPAFGVFVPASGVERGDPPAYGGEPGESSASDRPNYLPEAGDSLARDPNIDFLFLNLEGAYDADAVAAITSGVAASGVVEPPTLLVRIPPVSADGPQAAREHVASALELGADGVVVPHVADVEEARAVASFFADAGADVWSPSNPDGDVIAMILVEDPEAVAQVEEIADVPGYSALACGIGSLTRALDGDREAAEAGNQMVLAEATRAGKPDMIPVTANDVRMRVDQGFLGLLAIGADAGAVIAEGREAAGR